MGTITVYSAPTPRKSRSRFQKDKELERLGTSESNDTAGTGDLKISSVHSQPRRSSKELLGLSDEDRRRYTYMTLQSIDNDITKRVVEEGNYAEETNKSVL